MVVALEVIAVFVVIILVHELGHFLAAKAVGVGVERFSMGFGPVLLRRRVGETEYVLSAVPLGGYVKMVGEEGGEDLSDEERRRAFSHKPVARRFFIVFAGPFFNLVAAYALFGLTFFAFGVQTPGNEPAVGGVVAGLLVLGPGLRLAMRAVARPHQDRAGNTLAGRGGNDGFEVRLGVLGGFLNELRGDGLILRIGEHHGEGIKVCAAFHAHGDGDVDGVGAEAGAVRGDEDLLKARQRRELLGLLGHHRLGPFAHRPQSSGSRPTFESRAFRVVTMALGALVGIEM